MSVERDPGIYENDACAQALVEQQRAGILERVRTSKAVSVTLIEAEEDEGGIHWAFYAQDDTPGTFLVYCVVKAWLDAKAAIGGSDEQLYAIVREAIERGVGQ